MKKFSLSLHFLKNNFKRITEICGEKMLVNLNRIFSTYIFNYFKIIL